MPHAESTSKKSTMSPAQLTNGEKPASLFLSHLTTYPVVSDAVKTYKTNPYGAKSLDIAQIAYDKFAAPFVPYLRTPYSIVYPYLSKADSLADNGLTKVDEKFPVVKEETNTIKDTVFGIAFFPVRKAGEGKDYVFRTYADEHKKVGGDGYSRTAKAIVSTELRIAQEAYSFASSVFFRKKEEADQKFGQIKEQADQKVGQIKEQVEQKVGHNKEHVKQKADQKKAEHNIK